MGHGEEVTNAQSRQLLQRREPPQRTGSPMPQGLGRLPLSTHKEMEFPAAFYEGK
ncbi:hypothetical protein [Nostoc sp. ChiQUE01b]|uniref:hypothetical protein n=1 Tax=Nostoc sp. ChiQUE01b TaxID=3075376 RepID=UPI002AD430D3|nr:hypothetical protein [Nostoc sp. ChiQUE01b]MDZ8264696.1 hypothetical protein [Nostoc sp. ChiQUE01b]